MIGLGNIGRLGKAAALTLLSTLQPGYPSGAVQVLCRHPAVTAAAVVGLQDERLGEKVRACRITTVKVPLLHSLNPTLLRG